MWAFDGSKFVEKKICFFYALAMNYERLGSYLIWVHEFKKI